MHFFKDQKIIENINEDKIKEYLYYTLGEVNNVSFEIIPDGWENIIIKVKVVDERYILRLSSMNKNHEMFEMAEELIVEELNFITFLYNNNILVPKVYKTLDEDKMYKKIDTNDGVMFITLMEFIDGEHSLYTREMITITAKLQAKIHNISKNYAPGELFEKLKGDTNNYCAMAYKMRNIGTLRTKKFPEKLYLEMFEIYQENSIPLIEYYKSNPKFLIHSDIKANNIIVNNNEIKAVIDFGDLRWSVFQEDLGTYIWDMCIALYYSNEDFKPYLDTYFNSYSKCVKDFDITDEVLSIRYAIDRYLLINLFYLVENQTDNNKINSQIIQAKRELEIVKELLKIIEEKLNSLA